MTEKTEQDDAAFIAEALRRMKSKEPGIPAAKVEQFLQKLNDTWDQAGTLSEEEVRRMFKQFVAEAKHVPG